MFLFSTQALNTTAFNRSPWPMIVKTDSNNSHVSFLFLLRQITLTIISSRILSRSYKMVFISTIFLICSFIMCIQCFSERTPLLYLSCDFLILEMRLRFSKNCTRIIWLNEVLLLIIKGLIFTTTQRLQKSNIDLGTK